MFGNCLQRPAGNERNGRLNHRPDVLGKAQQVILAIDPLEIALSLIEQQDRVFHRSNIISLAYAGNLAYERTMTKAELISLTTALSQEVDRRRRLGGYSVEAGGLLMIAEQVLKLAHATIELQEDVNKLKNKK